MTLKIIGGTDAGDEPAPPVWESPTGHLDVLRRVAPFFTNTEGPCRPSVVVIARNAEGILSVFSNFESAEAVIGMTALGQKFVSEWINDTIDAEASADHDDGA
ncbi:hypothetical protein UFOVP706_9 [uncultured Caudovirales phage]|uniref:Uncharacterized protein n=1 Tax=uncultured Caudovirales phage TaxID=2100421 RepID=A0A6J5NI03_9CAUD|nr:hypothetical protein UFOVP706_9 [uncultured Caudovirales phage]